MAHLLFSKAVQINRGPSNPFAAKLRILLLFLLVQANLLWGQSFFYGADLSYVNEMEDCGVVYKENGIEKDPYALFSANGFNLARFRLWHTPSFYDGLNARKRYSDLVDVRKSIARAKAAGMSVLLDYHLSDTWADPGAQIAPVAWQPAVDFLTVIRDSLYNYLYSTLTSLHAEGLLPEMVQIGNETNRGILLSPAQNASGFVLNWARNATLFNIAIKAVRDVERETGKKIRVALHVSGPSNVDWLMDGFWRNGVKDFDIMGISYYWEWHRPTTIAQTAGVISSMRQKYPGKDFMVFETGYPWTLQWNDEANNVFSALHPNYAPASPAAQQQWLVDLSRAVAQAGGLGVIYWEPAWQSSPCFTQWGRGSHQENATFFDFSNQALPEGGLYWPQKGVTSVSDRKRLSVSVPHSGMILPANRRIPIALESILDGEERGAEVVLTLLSLDGKPLAQQKLHLPGSGHTHWFTVPPSLPAGHYVLQVFAKGVWRYVQRVVVP